MNYQQSESYINQHCLQYFKDNHSEIIASLNTTKSSIIQEKLSQIEIPNQNSLIWVDRNIQNEENQQYGKKFQWQYGKDFYGFDEESKAAQKVKETLKNNIVLITSAQCAYQLESLLKNTNINILIFCFNKAAHYELFLRVKQIKAICNIFDQIDSLQHKVMSENQIKEQLQLLVSAPITLEKPQYSHSKYHISIQFGLLIQQLNQEQSLSKEILFDEFSNLLKKNGYDKNEIQDSFQEIHYIRKQAKIFRKKKLIPFEIFIIIYAADYYWYINEAFAKRNYNDIKCILAAIYNGYQKQEVYNFKELYRGISLEEEDFHNLKKDFDQSLNEQSSLTWSNLSSTSTDMEVVKTAFTSSNPYSVIFKIYLNNQSPHPHYKIPIELAKYKTEKEILLFPQFEFMVEDLKQTGKQLNVTIRQVDNKFCYIFDKDKREEYWQKTFLNKVYPQLEELISIIYIRLEQLRSVQSEIEMNSVNQKRLKDEELYCLERIKELISLFQENPIIVNKFQTVLKILQTEIQKNQANYEDSNYVTKVKECVSQNCFQALSTQEIKEEQIKQFVTQSFQKTVEKSNSKSNDQINVKAIVQTAWKNTQTSILNTTTKENQNLCAVKIKDDQMRRQIERQRKSNSNQCILLCLSCPPDCNCGDRSPNYWTHAQCGSILQINVDGDVFCENQCSKIFIQDLPFICESKGKCVNKHRRATDFFMNLAQGLKAAETQLSDSDSVLMQLQVRVMQKWSF